MALPTTRKSRSNPRFNRLHLDSFHVYGPFLDRFDVVVDVEVFHELLLLVFVSGVLGQGDYHGVPDMGDADGPGLRFGGHFWWL